MQGYLVELEQKALKEISAAKTSQELEELRIRYLGRRGGELTKLMAELPALSIAEKRVVGPLLNEVKANIENALRIALGEAEVEAKVSLPLDVTAPGQKFPVGKLHPTTTAFYEILEIFKELGFS